MAMSPQYDAITGGIALRLPALQSPNYVAGSAGWIIKADGTAEFNTGTFRGQLTSGTNPGQHVILNNTSNGDAVDVYNGSNQLVYQITNTGAAISYAPAVQHVAASAGGLAFADDAGTGDDVTVTFATNGGLATHQTVLQVQANSNTGGAGFGTWNFRSPSHDHSIGATLQGTERGVTGSVVQADQTSVNNLVHIAQYTITTVAGELQTFNHGCAFTPAFGMAVFDDGSATNTATVSINSGSITATQATVAVVYEPFGTFPALNDTVIIDVMFVK